MECPPKTIALVLKEGDKMHCIIFVTLVISLVIFALNSVSHDNSLMNPVELCKKYFMLFQNDDAEQWKDDKGKSTRRIIWLPILYYCVTPFLLGLSLGLTKVLDSDIVETLLVVLSLITAMLFAVYTSILSLQDRIISSEKPNDKIVKLVSQTSDLLNFEILMTVFLVVLCLVCLIGYDPLHKIPVMMCALSVIIYSLLLMLFFNLLIVLKRFSRIVEKTGK